MNWYTVSGKQKIYTHIHHGIKKKIDSFIVKVKIDGLWFIEKMLILQF